MLAVPCHLYPVPWCVIFRIRNAVHALPQSFMATPQPNAAPTLAGRAVLALLLFVGFYVLALGIAAGLLYIPYAEVTYAHRVTARLDLFCIIAAGIIVWSILPRPDRFRPPGPRLTAGEQPRLFRAIEEVAGATGQAMPAEVYAVSDLNAWVAQRGGFMGFGSRRVMGLGLPLLQVLSVDEFRGVLAHEFGHYHGGDTALGPWIYRTRAAIERTLVGMSRHSTAIMKPFEWYMKMFVRVTHAISRRQEFVADALAARVVGVQHMASGLRAVHAAGAAYDPFWYGEFAPAVESGFRPPLAEGFRRFLATPAIATVVEEGLERELREEKADPYDTHPPLRERLAALRGLTPTGPTVAAEPALALLDDVAKVEEALLAAMVSGPNGAPAKLQPIAWERMLEEVWAPGWKSAVRQEGKRLDGLTVARVAEFAGDPLRFTACCGFSAGAAEQQQRMLTLLGAALGLVLLRRGVPVDAEPGAPITFTAGGVAIRPFEILAQLGEGGSITREQWAETAASLGIADLDLSTTADDPQPIAA